MLLADKWAVITGANRGIGRATVEKFVSEGAKVVACCRTITPEVSAWSEELSTNHATQVSLVTLDLEDEDAIKTATREILGISKQLDVLVNNAGVASGSLFQMTPIKEIKRLFEINFFGQLQLTQGLLRPMIKHGSGSIVNISSVAAYVAEPGTLAYGASKSAFARATQSLAAELGDASIRVNGIAPSVTRTDMYDQMSDSAREAQIESSALKRAAEAEEVANVALFLASDLSSFVNGQIIRVDGGIV